ncbi:pyruvate dehydrogenase X component [Cryptococcus neoformans C23]|uniref:Pyruvate dehydrogenase X component n=1 Tax=Cryptococcus neoformans (strain H99 / ATCC 208821 / CBS 10515 / FGSC 9487) TaxID=235443 RepID=J9VQH7_CRYN9|nr:pyruvate dehydrogenase X component [Cryptococcus neoformans var. grubii H99]AFR96732.2 pyruvate dehydrogenase X component [Cryptococcus neoformans var. grubii H99]AUB26684.1 pyruvate dehydrogenase X component [Cryptococcus neoformans var. grubii]OWZ41698.1 pyruvate dehydrogenase X component [Cryptococcus neoformans var. grubii C23]|eukprot:XP_012050981.1 pyruvate dehydrogenase X component [Cryptococcus neoformans var. grubii H99]
MRTTRQIVSVLRNARVVPPRPAVSNVRYATTNMAMPAMSPTMTEGGIASWKKSEGESFAAGDVLLEVETDKATIDVEAQEDGVMGKIVVQAGAQKIPVGQIIAVLAEEGDDLSSITIPETTSPAAPEQPKHQPKQQPKEEQKAAEQKAREQPRDERRHHEHKEIKHSKPLFPSVSRLLQESSLSTDEISKLKGTGRHGMLTKGDVLLALGKVKNRYGSAEKYNVDVMGPSGKRLSERGVAKEVEKKVVLDGPALRRLVVGGMAKATQPAHPIIHHETTPLPRSPDFEFDSILAPYAALLPSPQPEVKIPSKDELASSEGHLAHPRKDQFAGLY